VKQRCAVSDAHYFSERASSYRYTTESARKPFRNDSNTLTDRLADTLGALAQLVERLHGMQEVACEKWHYGYSARKHETPRLAGPDREQNRS